MIIDNPMDDQIVRGVILFSNRGLKYNKNKIKTLMIHRL